MKELTANERAYLWLSSLRDISPKAKYVLLQAFQMNAVTLLDAMDSMFIDTLISDGIIKPESKKTIEDSRSDVYIDYYIEEMEKDGMNFIIYPSKNYPSSLREIDDPPIVLYYRGDISLLGENERRVAIVGSRTPTIYGAETAKTFASRLSQYKIVVVSGLAAGIDGNAHKGCLLANGRTIGVVGGSVNYCYPKANFPIYYQMCEHELVISEFGPGVATIPANFPLRNRIIAGLSDGVLCIEARKQSGSLITTAFALDQNREVFAVPGRIGDRMSEGTNELISSSAAHLVTKTEDIIRQLYPEIKLPRERHVEYKAKYLKADLNRKRYVNPVEEEERNKNIKKFSLKNDTIIEEKFLLSRDESRIMEFLTPEPIYIDEIVRHLGWSVVTTLHILTKLECKKVIKQPIQGYYMRLN